MIITTDSVIDGKSIIEHKGNVYSEDYFFEDYNVKSFLKGFMSKISSSYKSEKSKAKEEALADLEKKAKKVGANAVINVSTKYSYAFGVRALSLTGVAVVIE